MTVGELNYQIMAMLGDAHIYIQVLLQPTIDLKSTLFKIDTHEVHYPMSRNPDPSESLTNATRDDKALSPLRGVVHCALAQASLGEPGPQLTGVRATGQGQVSVDDGVASRNHGWVARLPVKSSQHSAQDARIRH